MPESIFCLKREHERWLLFPQHSWYVIAGWVGLEEIASIIFSTCPAASADFAVLADSTSAFQVILVS